MTEDQSFYDGVDALHREAAAHALRLSDLENAVAAFADRLKVAGLADLIPVPDAVAVEDVVLTLAGQVDDLRRRMDEMKELHLQAVNVLQIHDQELSQRIDKLQDANLASVLESSALLVDLRRIADALETLSSCVSVSTYGTKHLVVGDIYGGDS